MKRADFETVYAGIRMAGGQRAIGVDMPAGVELAGWTMPPQSPKATIGESVTIAVFATDLQLAALKLLRPGKVTNEREV